jgi:hypothetical protein
VFKVSRTSKLGQVFSIYAGKKGIDVAKLRFLLAGNPNMDDETPEILDLEVKDEIDCFLHLHPAWVLTQTSKV